MAWALDSNLILWNTKLFNPKCVVLRPGLRSGGWIYEGYLLTKSLYWSITNEAVTVPELFFSAPRWSMQCRIKEKSLPTTQWELTYFWKNIPIILLKLFYGTSLLRQWGLLPLGRQTALTNLRLCEHFKKSWNHMYTKIRILHLKGLHPIVCQQPSLLVCIGLLRKINMMGTKRYRTHCVRIALW